MATAIRPGQDCDPFSRFFLPTAFKLAEVKSNTRLLSKFKVPSFLSFICSRCDVVLAKFPNSVVLRKRRLLRSGMPFLRSNLQGTFFSLTTPQSLAIRTINLTHRKRRDPRYATILFGTFPPHFNGASLSDATRHFLCYIHPDSYSGA